jgi:hypothetical protein
MSDADLIAAFKELGVRITPADLTSLRGWLQRQARKAGIDQPTLIKLIRAVGRRFGDDVMA